MNEKLYKSCHFSFWVDQTNYGAILSWGRMCGNDFKRVNLVMISKIAIFLL